MQRMEYELGKVGLAIMHRMGEREGACWSAKVDGDKLFACLFPHDHKCRHYWTLIKERPVLKTTDA